MNKGGFTLYELLVCVILLPIVFAIIIGPAHLITKGITNTGRCAADLSRAGYILSDVKRALANATEVSFEGKGTGTTLSGTLIDGAEFQFAAKDGVHMDVSIDFQDRLAVVNIALPSSDGRGVGVELTTVVYLTNLEGQE